MGDKEGFSRQHTTPNTNPTKNNRNTHPAAFIAMKSCSVMKVAQWFASTLVAVALCDDVKEVSASENARTH